jgi:hypothetical protein
MPLGVLFWVVFVVGLLANGFLGFWEPGANYRPLGLGLWMVVLVGILGWAVFGGIVK